ncbi:MAG: hypothetical protein H7145_01215 [Akkermansiaceae bacterium]|nr:hypothetical protein [Armatimonadota bacterium]
MNEIAVSAAEKAAGHLSPDNQAKAVDAIQMDGYVVLHEIVDTTHLDILQERMLTDLQKTLARPDAPFNFNAGDVQQDAPPFAPFLFDDILKNEVVIGMTKGVLGANLKMSFYSGNTALPEGRAPASPPRCGAVMARPEISDARFRSGHQCPRGGCFTGERFRGVLARDTPRHDVRYSWRVGANTAGSP